MKKRINVPLLRKVQKFLLAEPRRFDMGSWVELAEQADILRRPPCGTACCIAGAAFLIDKKIEVKGALNNDKVLYGDILGGASRALKIDDRQENLLFFVGWWPRKFQVAYNSAKTPLARAKAGVARINHFIKTKGAE